MIITHWRWLDSAVSLAVSVVILFGTWSLLRESLNLALDAVPEGIDPDDVRSFLCNLEGVTEVHDLHIWGMSTTETARTAHLVMAGGHPGNEFLRQVAGDLEQRFHIGHPTLQIELAGGEDECRLAPGDVV